MVEYTCQKCNRIFNHKHNYIYHIRRKNSCIPEKPEEKQEEKPKEVQVVEKESKSLVIYNPNLIDTNCVYCNKFFHTNSHRNRHMNTNCAIRKKYLELIKILDGELENLYLENRFLKSKYMGLFGDNHLFPFGTEKISGYDNNLIMDCIKNPYKSIPDFIESYHFNPLERRYNNVKIKNPKASSLEVYNGVNWVIETKENVIQTLLRNYKDIVDMEVEKLNENISENFIQSYNDFSELVDVYLSFAIYDRDITPYQKKTSKPIYLKIYTAIELMLINVFRKDVSHKIEEEIKNNLNKN